MVLAQLLGTIHSKIYADKWLDLVYLYGMVSDPIYNRNPNTTNTQIHTQKYRLRHPQRIHAYTTNTKKKKSTTQFFFLWLFFFSLFFSLFINLSAGQFDIFNNPPLGHIIRPKDGCRKE